MDEKAHEAHVALARLWRDTELPLAQLDAATLEGPSTEGLPSTFKIGDAALASLGATGLSGTKPVTIKASDSCLNVDEPTASLLHATRSGGHAPHMRLRTADALAAFRSEQLARIDGEALPMWDELAGVYRTRDGFVRPHTNWPHHKRGALAVFGLPPTANREELTERCLTLSADEAADEAMKKGFVVTALRSFDEWDAHPQGIVAAARTGSPVTVERLRDRPPRPLKPLMSSSSLPLEGVRVLDLTRVIAGPVAGRTLAGYGADVLWITSSHNPSLPSIDYDTSRGKRTVQLDFRAAPDRATFRTLVKDADVVLQAYRPGGLDALGFSSDELHAINPDLVYASLSAWGPDGPWAARKGFDSLVQFAVGINDAEGRAFAEYEGHGDREPVLPRAWPCQALDHAAGYLLAFGVQAALYKRCVNGGAFRVTGSLLSVATWIRSLGRLQPAQFSEKLATWDELRASGLIDSMERRDGRRVDFVQHPVQFDCFKAGWEYAPDSLNSDTPLWKPRS